MSESTPLSISLDPNTNDTPNLILNPIRLLIRETPSSGRGVFAPHDISAGTILEEAPVLILTKQEWEEGNLNEGVLGGYGFNWGNGGMGIGLGIGESQFKFPCPVCL